jgi:nucleoside phosphorylase
MKTTEIKGQVDFAIITIREDEFRAALQRFPPNDLVDGQRRYSLSAVTLETGERRSIIVVRTSEQGEGEAQNTARDLIEDLDPEWLVLLGIAGGVPAKEFTLGDVVLATRLHDFTIEARIEDQPSEYGITGGPMHKVAQDLLAVLAAHDVRGDFRGWNDEDRIGMIQPAVSLEDKNFYGDEKWIEKVKESVKLHFPHGTRTRRPLFTTGPTASSDRLIKDTQILQEWRRAARHIVTVEMELGGVYRAARRRQREYPILAIRGLSDIVGFKRDDNWTEYACHSAASFAHALISSGAVPRLESRRDENIYRAEFTSATPSAAEELRLASTIAAADARLVSTETSVEGNVYLDQDLYVSRVAEEKVVEHLKVSEDRRKPIVVIGEAGRGKTSLLWHIYSSLTGLELWEPWLIKSSMLVGSLREERFKNNLSSEIIVRAVDESISRRRRPILLVDTVDLLLHDESSRDFLVGLVLKLENLGCQTILSTRPQEVSRLNAFEFRRVTLLDYEGVELEEAITKHVNRFYLEARQESNVQQIASIMEAVARGLPLREVCENPLTLRMLFTIYRPAKIPPDINVFELYQQYWTHRVESDLRAGSPFAPPDSVNADAAAELVALAMLAEGSPEIPSRRVKQFLEEMGVNGEHLDVLASRGVLHSSDTGLTSFFHQTFFEHSAARGLLRRLTPQPLALIQKRLNARKDDLFITPIYEQALLLGDESDPELSAAAELAIIELFESNSLSALMSALYVYCHRAHVSATVRAAARRALGTSEEAVQIRFLELAPNIPSRRLSDLYEELNIIWDTGSLRTKDHFIDLLKRLVPRDWKSVSKFFDQKELSRWVFGQENSSTLGRKLLQVITVVSFFDTNWCWQHLLEFCGASLPRSGGRELAIAVVNFLVENASLFGRKSIASRFEEAMRGLTLDRARDFHELARSIGRLWAEEWAANGRSISSILSEVDDVDKVRAVTRTRGLPIILAKADETEAAIAVHHFETEQNHYNRSLWIDYVLPEWLEALNNSETTSDSLSYLPRHIVKVLSSTDDDWKRKAPFVEAIRYTNLTASGLSRLLPFASFSDPKLWMDQDRLAIIFGDGFFAGHPGPESAVLLLKSNPESHAMTISKVILPSLLKRILKSARTMDTFFEIALAAEDLAHIMRALEVLPHPSPAGFHKWSRQVEELCLNVLRSNRRPQQRRYAILVWEDLLRRGTTPVHELKELLKLMKSEVDPRVRGPLLAIIGRSTTGMKYDLDEVFEVLEPVARGTNLDLRRRALLAIANVITDFPGEISEHASRALDIALSPPLDAERLYSMRPVIERLVKTDVDLTGDLAVRLLKGAHEAGLGKGGRHKIYGRLKQTLRVVVRYSGHHRRHQLLGLVSLVDRILGSMITDAICHEALAELSPELDTLLDSDVPGDIKQIILRYRYTQERALGGQGWPEIYQTLRSSRKRAAEPGQQGDSITIHGDNYGNIQQGGQENIQSIVTKRDDET